MGDPGWSQEYRQRGDLVACPEFAVHHREDTGESAAYPEGCLDGSSGGHGERA